MQPYHDLEYPFGDRRYRADRQDRVTGRADLGYYSRRLGSGLRTRPCYRSVTACCCGQKSRRRAPCCFYPMIARCFTPIRKLYIAERSRAQSGENTKERSVMKRKGRKILAVVLCLALMAGPVPVFASAAEAAEEEERERTQALYGEEEEPKESSPGETEFVPTPAESENIRERMSELAWEINQLDDQIAGLAPEEADALQQEREVKMQEYEAGEAELYAMGAIPTEEELREVTGLGQESESGISFRSLPNFSSISQVYLVTHMQCRMTYRGHFV